MKKAVFILILALAFSVCVRASADCGGDMSLALSIMEECGGEPGPEEIEKLRGLGLSDEDIDGLSLYNTLRKDREDPAPYVAVISAVAILCAAAVVCVVRSAKVR